MQAGMHASTADTEAFAKQQWQKYTLMLAEVCQRVQNGARTWPLLVHRQVSFPTSKSAQQR